VRGGGGGGGWGEETRDGHSGSPPRQFRLPPHAAAQQLAKTAVNIILLCIGMVVI